MISHEKSIGAVILRKTEGRVKFLILHYKSGHWDFPKGHVEENESDEETLRREVMEETGITDLKLIPGFNKEVEYSYDAKGNEKIKRIKNEQGTSIKKKVAYYLAETESQDVKISHEHIGYAWLNYGDALERITYDNSKNVLKSANDFSKGLQG